MRDFTADVLFELHSDAKQVAARIEDARRHFMAGRVNAAADCLGDCIYPVSHLDHRLNDLRERLRKAATP